MANGSFRCLIGVDGSDGSDEAFNFFLHHIHRPDYEAFLLYVVPPLVISSNEMATHINGVREKNLLEERSKVKHLKEIYEEKMRSNGVRGKINVIYYSKKPGKVICDLAAEEKCSLILLGCPRIRSSSTIEYCLKKAPCSVMITKINPDGRPTSSPSSPTSPVHYQFPSASRLAVPTWGKDNGPQRRISCPVVTSPPPELPVPHFPEGTRAEGGDERGAAGNSLEVKDAHAQRFRRHSTVVNAFQNFALHNFGLRKMSSSNKSSHD